MLNSPDPPAAIPVNALPSPAKLVAVNAPEEELNVRLVPLLGSRFPVAAVVNKTLEEVSLDSSATVTAVAMAAVPLVS